MASSVRCQFDDDQMVTFSARGILTSMRRKISSAILSEPRFTDTTALLSTFPNAKFDVADCLGGDHPAALVEHAGSDHNSDVGVIMMATPRLALRYSWGRFVSILRT